MHQEQVVIHFQIVQAQSYHLQLFQTTPLSLLDLWRIMTYIISWLKIINVREMKFRISWLKSGVESTDWR